MGAGPHTLECIRSKGLDEVVKLLLNGKAVNFASLHPLQSEIL